MRASFLLPTRIWLPLLLGLTGLTGACSGDASSRSGPPRHLILVSLDTLRADRLGCYGYDRDTSPVLDDLARRGVLFENVVSETSWTLPAHTTLFTGLPPETHGVVSPELQVGEATPLLAEVLRRAGFRTFAGTGGGYMGREFGFARGFERFDDEQIDLAETLEDARAFLKLVGDEQRAFLFVHTYDVHCPYEPAEEFARRFRSPEAQFVATDGRCGNPDYNSMTLTPGQVRHISDRYDASIREADSLLGTFLEWLASEDLLDETLLVVTSDHGEEFGEHGQIGHERSVYRELLRVPLILAGPGLRSLRVEEPIGLAEVAPTLLELLGLGPLEGAEGVSLAARIDGTASPGAHGPRFSSVDWQAKLRSVVEQGYHLVLDEDEDRVWLFASDDVLEAHDLSGSEPERAEALRERIDAHFGGRVRREVLPVQGLSEEELARLRALGYVE